MREPIQSPLQRAVLTMVLLSHYTSPEDPAAAALMEETIDTLLQHTPQEIRAALAVLEKAKLVEKRRG